MFFFPKKETIYLCPEVNGTLTFEGVPLANHPIRIAIVYGDKIPLNEFIYTDEIGNFHFKGYQISRVPNLIFEPPRIAQQILTIINGNEYRLWEAHIPGDGSHDLDMVKNKLQELNAALKKDMVEIKYEHHCHELPNSYLLVKSVLNLNGMNRR